MTTTFDLSGKTVPTPDNRIKQGQSTQKLDEFNPLPLADGTGSTGWELLAGPYIGELATAYTFDGPCYAPTG